MSKLRSKFIAVLAVLFCALLCISTAFLIPKSQTASANSSISLKNVGELVYSGTGSSLKFDGDKLSKLYKNIVSDKDSPTLSDVSTKIDNSRYTLGGRSFTKAISGKMIANGDEFTVTFGNQVWIPVYLSKSDAGSDGTGSNNGHVILTLWLAECSDKQQWGFFDDGTFDSPNCPTNYGSSYIRAYLNPNTKYAKSKSETTLSGSTSSDWHTFVGNYGSYLVTPDEMEWQRTLTARGYTNSGGYDMPNEACAPIPSSEANWCDNYSSTVVSQNGKPSSMTVTNAATNHYFDWKDDKLWLPAISEVGGLNADADTVGMYGLWDISKTQRMNSISSWMRRCKEYATTAGRVDPNGVTSTQAPTSQYAARPALHLDLTQAEGMSVRSLPVPTDVSNVYSGSKQTLNDLTDKPDWYTKFSALYGDDSIIKVEYPQGTNDMLDVSATGYEVSVTIVSNKYRWSDSTSLQNLKRTFIFKIEEKPLEVIFVNGAGATFNTANPVTSGDAKNYPVAAFPQSVKDGEIYEHDKPEGGDNPNQLFPKLKTKYTNAAGNNNSYSDYKIPTLPGKYRATAEMENDCNYCLAEDDPSQGYYGYREFTIEKIKVAVPSLALGEGETVSSINNFVYDGNAHTVKIPIFDNALDATQIFGDITAYSDLVTITATDATTLSYNEITHTATATNANTYTLTARLKNAGTMEWDSGGTDAKPLTFTIKKAQLRLDFADGDPDDGADFDKGEWARNPSGSVKFVVNVDGEIGSEQVVLKVYYTEKDGGDETVLNDQGGRTYSIRGDLEKGDYKLYAELVPSVATNANYEIAISGSVVSKIDKAFKVTSAQVGFKADALVWQYTNGDTTQDIASGNHVTYNGNAYTISLKTTDAELEALGVKKESAPSGDISKENSNAHPDEGEVYIITVKIVALTADYEYEGEEITFKWYIDQAEYVLDSYGNDIEWWYKARDKEYKYEDGAEYEGGTDAGDAGWIEMFIKSGLPDGLKASYQGHRGREVGDNYTVTIDGLENTNHNYKDLTQQQLSSFSWKTFSWKIVPRKLPTSRANWIEDVEFADRKVTKAPTLNTFPYNVHLEYTYYETKACDGTAYELKDLTYEEGKSKTYYVKVTIKAEDQNNYILEESDSNPFEFEVGVDKIAVEIEVKSGGTYDGTEKAATVSIVGTVDGITTDAFELKYYEAGSTTPLGSAPVNAGNYRVEISLKAGYTKYYIKSEKVYNFTIETLKLTVPPAKLDNLTYNGEEQDIAKLVELPDGWENYISIDIKSLTQGVLKPDGYKIKLVADYEVVFSIKSGVNTGTPNNVEWSDGSKIQKKLSVSIVTLVLHAEGWTEKNYDSYIVFTENDVDKFVVYTVTDIDGKPVDRKTVEDSENESFIVTVAVAEEHLGNVEIVFNEGVSSKYEFFTNGGIPPVKVKLPTIPELTFNGKDQTFEVDYGEFADYIEIDTSLSNPNVLTQFNADTYEVYFKIKSGVNAVWADTDNRKAIAVKFEMKPLILEDPKVKDGEKFTYNGSEQSATLNIDVEFLDIAGDYSATQAGKYSFTLAIKERFAGNVVWANTGEKSVDWEIEKAKISVKWTDSEVPELDLPEGLNDVDIEYVFTDENGKKVSKDELEPGKKYTVTATLSDGSSANYEFVDESGKALKTSTTEGHGFEIKNKNSSFPWWIIALIAGVLLLLAVLIVVIVKRRQTADGEDEYDDFYDDEYDFDEDIEEDFDDDFGEEY